MAGKPAEVGLKRGTLVVVSLDPTVGHEQRGQRPCVVVSGAAINLSQRFPLIAVVPITGTAGEGALYPKLTPRNNGLTKTSWALIDQVRSVDKQRLTRLLGTVDDDELAAIDLGLRLYLGLHP